MNATSGERQTHAGEVYVRWHAANYMAVYRFCKDLSRGETPAVIAPVYHCGIWGTLPGEAL